MSENNDQQKELLATNANQQSQPMTSSTSSVVEPAFDSIVRSVEGRSLNGSDLVRRRTERTDDIRYHPAQRENSQARAIRNGVGERRRMNTDVRRRSRSADTGLNTHVAQVYPSSHAVEQTLRQSATEISHANRGAHLGAVNEKDGQSSQLVFPPTPDHPSASSIRFTERYAELTFLERGPNGDNASACLVADEENRANINTRQEKSSHERQIETADADNKTVEEETTINAENTSEMRRMRLMLYEPQIHNFLFGSLESDLVLDGYMNHMRRIHQRDRVNYASQFLTLNGIQIVEDGHMERWTRWMDYLINGTAKPEEDE